MSWNDGYFTDLDYAYRYQYLISPLNIQMCLLLNGYVWPTNKTYRYLELGFGQGISLNTHAAVSEGEFFGVDFNADFSVLVKSIASASEVNVNIYNESFKTFVGRTELPEFDIIVLHGVWSWISEENQKIIIDFVKRKLSIGGVFYVSYNTPLGKWVRAIPLRNMMKLYYDRVTAQSEQAEVRVKKAVDFMEHVAMLNQMAMQKNPQLGKEIEFIKNTRSSYVAGEYFGKHWNLVPFSTMAETLSEAKLTFAGHASMIKNLDFLYLSEPARNHLSHIKDPILNEQTRDFLSTNEFRCDIWIKGSKPLSMVERNEKLKEIRFSLTRLSQECDLAVEVPAGKIELPSILYTALLDCLSRDNFKPKSAKDLAAYDVLKQIDEKQIIDALIVLCALGYIFVAQSTDAIHKAKERTDALNLFILEQAVHDDSMPYLVSPVTGCAVELTRIQKIFLLARAEGAQRTDAWATLAWQLLSKQSSVVVLDNQLVASSAEEGLSLLNTMAQKFAQNRLPLLQTLGIVD